MKILICSKLFYPSNSIGAVRPTNFAKHLSILGHDVVVVTEDRIADQDFELEGVDIIRIPNSHIIQRFKYHVQLKIDDRGQNNRVSKNSYKENSTEISQIHFVTILKTFYKKSRRQFYSLIIDIDWYLIAKKLIKSKFKKGHFDIVLSSYGPISSLILGCSFIKLKLAKYWISDLRDNLVNEEAPFWLNIIYSKAGEKAIKYAHAITLVSRGQKEMFERNNRVNVSTKNKIFVIYNGFEGKITPLQSKNKDNDLKITYTGQLYSGKREISLLFHVIDELIEEEIIDASHIKILYAGSDSDELIVQIKPFKNVIKIYEDLGFVSREKAMEIQKQSDLLVVLTWNTIAEQGILTGKFQEYLQAYKPIISLTSGNLPNGELTEMINKLNLGIACEYINYEESYDSLKAYILAQYKQIQDGNPLIFEPNIEGAQLFHYEKLARRLENICLDLVQNG